MPDREERARASRRQTALVGLVLLGILVLAIGLRFAGLGVPSLWLDEILHVGKAREAAAEPWPSWLLGLRTDRENGPLYYATQILGAHLLDGEAGPRLTPALLGVSTVIVMAAAGAALGGAPGAIAASALIATAPLSVYLSREGRPYSGILLIASLLLLVLLRADRPRAAAAAYAVCALAAYYASTTTPLLISFGLVAGLGLLRTRGRGRGTELHFLLAAVLGVALVTFLYLRPIGEPTEPIRAREAERTVVLSRTGMERLVAGLTVSGVDWATADIRSGAFLALALLGAASLSRRDPYRALCVGTMCVLPLFGTLLYLSLTERWFLVRYAAPALPALLLLVAAGLGWLVSRLWSLPPLRRTRDPVFHSLAMLLLVALLAGPGLRAARSEPYQKPDWRGLLSLVGELSVDGEPVLTAGIWPTVCAEHYVQALSLPLPVVNVGAGPGVAEETAAEAGNAWLVAAGYLRADALRAWMRTADPIARSRLSQIEVFFYPDFRTFLDTRFAAGRGARLRRELLDPGGRARIELAGSELLIGRGWSYPEVEPGGKRYRWASARVAQIGLPTWEAADAHIRVGLLPLTWEGAEPQTVLLRLNGRILGKRRLGPGWQDVEMEAPAELWRPGANLLTLGFARLASPADVVPGSRDTRRLAAAVDRVELSREALSASSDHGR